MNVLEMAQGFNIENCPFSNAAYAGFRPEYVRLLQGQQTEESGLSIKGEVITHEMLGTETLYKIDTPFGRIQAKNGTTLNIPVKPVVKTREFAVGSNTLVRRLLPYLMVAPAIAASLIFLIYPIIYMFRLSFYKWNMVGEMKFIGLDNYIDLFSDPEFMQVLLNTCQFTFWTVAGSIVLGLVLAVYLKKNTRINRFIQGIMFTPYVLPMISIAFVWMWIMDTDLGLLNYVLGFLGIDKVMWLNDPKVAMYSLIIVNIWKAAGYYTLIFLSALQSIPS